MAKKGQVQLQAELNTDEDWYKFVKKKGLLVVDVYSEWCGPCAAMVNTLRKIKVEIGGDNLQLAIAKSDDISCLERFRNKSEPTWMFISGGGVVRLMFGSNTPKLTRVIIEELNKEIRVMEGLETRSPIGFSDLTPQEQERFDEEQAIREAKEKEEAEALAKEIAERRYRFTKKLSKNVKMYGLFLFWPQVVTEAMASISEGMDEEELHHYKSDKPVLSEEQIDDIFFYSDFKPEEEVLEALMSGPCLTYLVKFSDDLLETVTDKCLRIVYGEDKKAPGAEECPARKLITHAKKKEPSVCEEPVEEVHEEVEVHKDKSAKEVHKDKSAREVHKDKSAKEVHKDRSAKEVHKDKSEKEVHPAKSEKEMGEEGERGEEVAEHEKSEEKLEEIEEEIELGPEIPGLWTPPTELAKAAAMYVLFRPVCEPLIEPEPEPTPPHVAVIFNHHKLKDVVETMQEHPKDVLRLGFFSSENPKKAEVLARSIEQWERRKEPARFGDKLVLQLSKKTSDALLSFSTLGPTYISPNVEEGEHECKLFFPEGYDNPPEDEGVEEQEEKEESEGDEEEEGEDEEADGEPEE